jgi:hypothetical protein
MEKTVAGFDAQPKTPKPPFFSDGESEPLKSDGACFLFILTPMDLLVLLSSLTAL